MPFGVDTNWQRQALPKPEIVSYPLETTVIDSVVLSATGVSEAASGSVYAGRRYLVQGTILEAVGDGTYKKYDGTGTIAGILFDTVEFADGSTASNEPVAMLRRNVSFNSANIVDFATHEADLIADLSTCEFL
jgi:hypothetical protein